MTSKEPPGVPSQGSGASQSSVHGENGNSTDLVDLTLDDDSDSDIDIQEDALSQALDSTSAGPETNHIPTVNSMIEDENDDDPGENVVPLGKELIRSSKRKHMHPPDDSVAPKPDLPESAKILSPEGIRSFFGNNLKSASNFFTVNQSNRTQTTPVQTLPADRPSNTNAHVEPNEGQLSLFLNVDREEIFGKRRKKSHRPRKNHDRVATESRKAIESNAQADNQNKRPEISDPAPSVIQSIFSTDASNIHSKEPGAGLVDLVNPETNDARSRPDSLFDETLGDAEEPHNHTSLSGRSHASLSARAFDYHGGQRNNSSFGRRRPGVPTGPGAGGRARRTRPQTTDSNHRAQPARTVAPIGNEETPENSQNHEPKSYPARYTAYARPEGITEPNAQRTRTVPYSRQADRGVQKTGLERLLGPQYRRPPETERWSHKPRPGREAIEAAVRLLGPDIPRNTATGNKIRQQLWHEAPSQRRDQPQIGPRNPRHQNSRTVCQQGRVSQSNASAVKISSAPKGVRLEGPRLPTQDEFEAAAAQFKALEKRHESKRTATVGSILPADFGKPQPDHQSRARAVKNIPSGERELNHLKKVIHQRKYRIKKQVEQDYPDDPEEVKKNIVEQRFEEYLQNKEKRMRSEKSRQRTQLDVEFLENGNDGSLNGDEVDLNEGDMNKGKIPASEAIGSSQAIAIYCVYLSKPIESADKYEDSLMRTKAFGNLDKANQYAKLLLDGSPSQRSKTLVRPVVSLNISYANGLLFGVKERGDGKSIHVLVRKEQVLRGDMDPDVLRGRWVDEEVVDVYRKRYDVVEIKYTPEAHIEAEKKAAEETKAWEKQQKEHSGTVHGVQGREVQNQVMDQEEEGQQLRGLEGDELRSALRALPACGAPSRIEAEHAEGSVVQVQREDETQHEEHDDLFSLSDSNSVADQHPGEKTTIPARRDDERLPASDRSESDRSPTPPLSANPGHDPLNPYASVEADDIYHGSFTDLRSANERAFAVASTAWRPRGCDMQAVEHWRNVLLPGLAEERKTTDLDSETAEIKFPVPAYHGPVSRRPWMFIFALVRVRVVHIEGPMDTEIDFVMDLEKTHTAHEIGAMVYEAAAAAEEDRNGDVIGIDDSEEEDQMVGDDPDEEVSEEE